jgi:predicted ABC-type ATPase
MKRRRTKPRQKKIVIIAGPNGAGKSTFAEEFLPGEYGCTDFIDADLIARGLSPFAPERAAIQAGKIMLMQIESKIARGVTSLLRQHSAAGTMLGKSRGGDGPAIT